MSVSARLDAVLSDGSHLLLLGDRGWSESGPSDVWERTSVEEIESTARAVVGPDEAGGKLLQRDVDLDHWRSLAATLRRHGVEVEAVELRRLSHDVVLGERLRARLSDQPDTESQTSL